MLLDERCKAHTGAGAAAAVVAFASTCEAPAGAVSAGTAESAARTSCGRDRSTRHKVAANSSPELDDAYRRDPVPRRDDQRQMDSTNSLSELLADMMMTESC